MEDIFEMAREQAGWVSSAQFPSAWLLKYANVVYKEIQNALIRKVNENYFYDILYADTLAWQNEYTLKSTNWTTIWCKKIITGNIKRKDADSYYTKLKQSSTNLSEQAIDEQKSNPDQESFIQIKDGSVFVFPAPTETVNQWLMVEAIVSLIDLTVDWAENTIFPYNSELRDYHKIIAYGIVPYIYGKLKQTNEKISAKNEYLNELNIMMDEISDRFNNDLQWALPNWNMYK